MTPPRRLLDVAEAAERLNISKNHVYKLAADGVLMHRRLGRRVLIPESVVDELCGPVPAATVPLDAAPAGSAGRGFDATSGAATGAAGPRGGGAQGKSPANGSSGHCRPAAPTTTKPAGAGTPAGQRNAG